MKRNLFLTLTVLLLVTSTPAGEIGHFAGGLMNIRDYIVPEPGVYGLVYNYYYTTDRINDGNGDKIKSVFVHPGPGPGVTLKTDVDVDMYVLAPAVIWITPWEVLGARVGGFVAPTFANASLSAGLHTANGRGGHVNEANFNVGDTFVQPLWLGWSLSHWDFSLGYGFYAPTGKYDTEKVTLPVVGSVKVESPENIGYGFWEQQVQGAVAWYPMTNKATAVVMTLTYENCQKKQDFDLTPGNFLTLNWGASQYLPLKKDQTLLLEVGPAGYDTWQITDDSGSDSNNKKDLVHAVGGQLGVTCVPWNAVLNFHYFYEFYSENRFQGHVVGASLAKKF